MNMAKILKNAGIFVLCMAMCLAIAVPSFAAENVAAESSARYFFGSEEAEDFSQVGDYTVKWDVCNYGSEAVTAVILTGKFKGEKLQGVDISDEPKTITTGAKITLEETVTLTEADVEAGVTLESYLWKSTQSLVPVGGGTPSAPTGLEITNVTNSTVDLTWDKDTTGAIESYKLYRNGEELDSSYITETEGKMSYYDVGIEHNIPVSYTVKAVDFTGKESAASDAVEETTDDIARLWLGAAALTADDKTQITDENYSTLMETERGVHNFNIVDVFSNETETVSSKNYTPSIRARKASSTLANGETLGLNAVDFDMPLGRIIATLDSEFLDKIENEKELKVIVNYLDTRTVGGTIDVGNVNYDNVGAKRPTQVISYATENETGLTGIMGYQTTVGASYKKMWGTNVMTVPTVNATGTSYPNVVDNKKFSFKTTTSTDAGWGNTGGKDAMFAIGSNNNTMSSATNDYTVIMQKIDIAAADYVPYGAVLDFDKQEDTQFVEFSRKTNTGTVSSDVNAGKIDDSHGNKNAMELYADVPYPEQTDDNPATAKLKQLTLGMSKSYITPSDNKLFIRVTYWNNSKDENSYDKLQVIWKNTSGTNSYEFISRDKNDGENGEWVTKTIAVDNAALSTHDSGARLTLSTNSTTPWYISRVEVIKRTK